MQQLVVVMFVRMLVCRQVVRVIHPRAQVRIVEILILVVQPNVWPTSWQDTRLLRWCYK